MRLLRRDTICLLLQLLFLLLKGAPRGLHLLPEGSEVTHLFLNAVQLGSLLKLALNLIRLQPFQWRAQLLTSLTPNNLHLKSTLECPNIRTEFFYLLLPLPKHLLHHTTQLILPNYRRPIQIPVLLLSTLPHNLNLTDLCLHLHDALPQQISPLKPHLNTSLLASHRAALYRLI